MSNTPSSGGLLPRMTPEHTRRVRLHALQWAGIPLLLAVPVLALLGVFGESFASEEAVGSELALRAEYSTRYRYKQINAVQVSVENVAEVTLDTVVVSFDPAYVRQFSTLVFIPAPQVPFEVRFTQLEPGMSRIAWAELQGEKYGMHRGTLEAYSPGRADTTRVTLRTLILP